MSVFFAWMLPLLLQQLIPVFSIKEILISSYAPVADCSLTDPLNSSLFTGIEIDITRDAFSRVNWTEGVDYYFNCTTFDDITDILADTTFRPNAIGSVCGISISTYYMLMGYKFSQPTMTTGVSILHRSVPQTVFYLRSFSGSYLALLACLPFLGGLILYFFQERKSGVVNYIYHILTTFFKVDDDVFLGFSSRLAGLGFKLLLLITMILYVALTTSILANDNSFGGVSKISDLYGLKISTMDFYEELVLSVGGIYQEVPEVVDTTGFIQEIEQMQIDYIAYDDPIVVYAAYTQCDMYVAIQNFATQDYAMMMPGSISFEDEELINTALTLAYQDKTQTEWTQDYYTSNNITKCENKPVLGTNTIQFADLGGLWYAWLVAILFSSGLWASQLIVKSIKSKKGIYHFVGIRAEADSKIQGKMTALTATHCAGSVAAINAEIKFFKRYYYQILQKMMIEQSVQSKIKQILAYDTEFQQLNEFSEATNAMPLSMIKRMNNNQSIFSLIKRALKAPISEFKRMKTNSISNIRSQNFSLSDLSPQKLSDAAPLSLNFSGSLKQLSQKHQRIDNSEVLNIFKPALEQTRPTQVPRRKRISSSFIGTATLKQTKEIKIFNQIIMQIYSVKSSLIDDQILSNALERLNSAQQKATRFFTEEYFSIQELNFLFENSPTSRVLKNSVCSIENDPKTRSNFIIDVSPEQKNSNFDKPNSGLNSRHPRRNIAAHKFISNLLASRKQLDK